MLMFTCIICKVNAFIVVMHLHKQFLFMHSALLMSKLFIFVNLNAGRIKCERNIETVSVRKLRKCAETLLEKLVNTGLIYYQRERYSPLWSNR
jgi:hypothetical protein